MLRACSFASSKRVRGRGSPYRKRGGIQHLDPAERHRRSSEAAHTQLPESPATLRTVSSDLMTPRPSPSPTPAAGTVVDIVLPVYDEAAVSVGSDLERGTVVELRFTR